MVYTILCHCFKLIFRNFVCIKLSLQFAGASQGPHERPMHAHFSRYFTAFVAFTVFVGVSSCFGAVD